MVQGYLKPNITFLGEKLWPVAWNKKMCFFLMSQGSFNPKIRFLGQKVCFVAHTDSHTQKWIQKTPFQGFRIFSFKLSSRIGPKTQRLKKYPMLPCLIFLQYLGDWYEIYAFPTTFEKGGCTRARYTKKDNGHINILNRSIQNNNTITAVGDAFQPNSSDPGR